MKRDYASGTADDILFFTGNEVEHTPAYNMRTLFVVGIHSISAIEDKLDHTITHIYFGANQSFTPTTPDEWMDWDQMIMHFIKREFLVTLDFDVKHTEALLDSGFTEHHNFIPMISVKLPYINQLGYNAVVKLDDKGFNASNPGVWCHSLHNLQDRSKFTDWSKYTKDKAI